MKRLSLLLTGAVLLAVTPPAWPDGACCFDDGGCLWLRDTICTETWGGRFPGEPADCDDTDNDGIVDDCAEGPFAVEFPKLYWISPDQTGWSGLDKLQRADLNGTNVQTLLVGLRSSRSIAIDSRQPALYWLDTWSQIHRAHLDGSDDTIIVDDYEADTLAVDEIDRKLYWSADGIFKRADLDGSNIEIVLSGNWPIDFAIVHDPRKACTYVDADADGDVDLHDFAAFQACFSEPDP